MTNNDLLVQKTSAVKKAINLAGSQKALAALCGLKQQNIRYWLKYGAPIKHVLTLESKLDFKIKRYELAPDFYSMDT